MNKFIFKHFIFSLLLIIITPAVHAYQINIIEEGETGLKLRIEDTSTLEWRNSQAYPKSGSAIHLGTTELIEISPEFSIPVWSVTIALPSPDKPSLSFSNIKTELIKTDQQLIQTDIQQINEKPTGEITEIGYLRFSPFGEIVIYPVKVKNESTIEVIRSLEIIVNYSLKSNKTSPNISKTENTTVYNSIINKKYLNRWQSIPETKLLKKTASLPSGKWFKITIEEDGIYQISHQELVTAGMENQSIDINRLFLYSNGTGGREIDYTPGIDVIDNLIENTRNISGSENGYFDNGDALVFYGRASSGVDANELGVLSFNRNAYSNVNYYWLLLADAPGNPKSMEITNPVTDSYDFSVNKYEKIDRHELELYNFLRSGKAWYGEKFSNSGTNTSVIFQVPEKSNDDPDNYQVPATLTYKARGADKGMTHIYKLYLNGATTPFISTTMDHWYVTTKQASIYLKPGIANIIKINYTSSHSSGQAYVDYLEIRYQAPLMANGSSLDFWGPAVTGVVEYNLSEIDFTSPVIYDITDWANVSILNTGSPVQTVLTFKTLNSIEKRSHYWLTEPSEYSTVEEITLINNIQWTTLRNSGNSAQYIIITDESFADAAEDLAKLYSQDVKAEDRLSTIIAYQSQILREFNGDLVDPHAIRQFLKYAIDNWVSPRPQYVILLGDGTFDYRHIESKTGDYVMTYEVEENIGTSNYGFASYATDMRFTYTHGNDKKMDLAIGRINARSASNAQAAVDKIRSYLTEPIYGDWRSNVTLVADDPVRPDQDEQGHIRDMENSVANYIPETMNLNKIYLLEYPEITDASTYGVKKPDATDDILKQIENGTVLINYFGHGSPTVWAQEYILEMNRDMGRLNTGMKLPFWIAGTCSWGQFDDISGSCFPEALVLEPENGGIAALAATRATYGTPNASFINRWIKIQFNNVTANRIRLGSILQTISINSSGLDDNSEKYILFGDPALYLALPYYDLTLDSLLSDTLKSLSNVHINGIVSDELDSYNGEGILKLYDSERQVTRSYINGWDKENSMSYTLPGEILYSGRVNITDRQFSSKFFIPKDLNYAGNSGKITITGWNEETQQVVGGYYDPIYYSGSESVFDTTGPDIRIGFIDINFQNGDVVTPDDQFEIAICDPIGVNVAGKVGHDITLIFDEDVDQSYVVTEYFTYDTNSDSSGSVIFPLPDLSEGVHSINVTAWDNGNNSTTIDGTFSLLPTSDFALEKVVNYPNPFAKNTDITFHLTHSATLACTIYTVRGLKVCSLEYEQLFQPGFNSIHWDGRDDFGDVVAKGIYLYKIRAKSIESNEKDTFIGKMVKAG